MMLPKIILLIWMLSPMYALSSARDTISIVAVGDIMIGSAYPSKAYLPKDDAQESFAAVKEYLKGDIVFGNLEGVLLDKGESDKCKNSTSGLCYAFRMPERYAKIIQKAGFNLLSTANNHAGDFGVEGMKKTTKILDLNGIYNAGNVEKKYTVFSKNGIKYGFCAFSPNNNMLSVNDLPQAIAIVQELKKVHKVDVLIVSFHAGAEGGKHTRVPKKKEIFYGENRGDVHLFSHTMIDNGADIVLGHGPHITRAIELYKNKLIAYSLGNFNTYGLFNLKGLNGIAPLMNIKLDKNGNFLCAEIISVKQTKQKGLELDREQKALHEIIRLTELDFPNTPLKFINNKVFRK